MFFSLLLRVFTGAAEVQVNVTSIIIEQYESVGSEVDKESILRGVVVSNPTDATSIPNNLKTFATYKKYLQPESTLQFPKYLFQTPFENVDFYDIFDNTFSQSVLYQPTSHSPPSVVATYLYTYTTKKVESVNLENYFEEIKNSYSGEIYSL